jgi:hypothetical protein
MKTVTLASKGAIETDSNTLYTSMNTNTSSRYIPHSAYKPITQYLAQREVESSNAQVLRDLQVWIVH